VSKRPDTAGLQGGVSTEISSTNDGGTGYNAAAEVNVPFAEKAAVRASAFYSRDGGYIDNLALARKDINRAEFYGGRFDALFTPTDALTVRIGGFLQDIHREGTAFAGYGLDGIPIDGSLDQRYQLPEYFDQQFRLVSATVDYDLGPAKLTSI